MKKKMKNSDEIKIKMKRMKNKLKSRLIQYNWKFEDLIKLQISLINQIKGLINCRINKFWDLIELVISLINGIRGLIDKLPKFGVGLGHNCKE